MVWGENDRRMPYWQDLYENVAAHVNEIARSAKRPLRLLDVGCGRCVLKPLLRGVEYVGVDRDESLKPAPYLLRADFLRDEIRGTFDVVVALNVLECLSRPEMELLFSRARSWLADGGWFITSLTNEANPIVAALRALGLKKWQPLMLDELIALLAKHRFDFMHLERAGSVFLPFWLEEPFSGRETATVINEELADRLNSLVKDDSYSYFLVVYCLKG
jgi:hypothetical protein